MTYQVKDDISIENQKYAIDQRSNWEGWFDPTAHGVYPEIASSACVRGFHCAYTIRDRVIADRPNATTTWDFSLYDRERQILAEFFKCKY
jgi:hypothetical protein